MTKIKGLVMALLFPAACAAAGVDELAEELARTAPMPCMDVAMPLQLDPSMQQGVDSFLVELGQDQHVPSGWRAGNKHYDASRALLLESLRTDEELRPLVARYNGQAEMRVMFRRANVEELSFLREFFKTRAGQVFWEYVLDGALCKNRFGQLAQSGPMSMSPEQARLKETWMSRLAVRNDEFQAALGQLDPTQKSQFDRAWNLTKRLNGTTAPDEQAYQDSKFEVEPTQRAYKRIYRAALPKILEQVDQFKAGQPPGRQ